ncbi:hypothetical protein Hanom_Chr07g00667501 [Helianthus anomalus]
MAPINSSTSLQSYSKNTIGFHITMNFFSGSTYIDGLTFFTVIIYIYNSLNPFLKFTYRFTICKFFLYFIWLKVHQGISFLESVFCFHFFYHANLNILHLINIVIFKSVSDDPASVGT